MLRRLGTIRPLKPRPDPAPTASPSMGLRSKIWGGDWGKASIVVGVVTLYGLGFIVANSFLETYTVLSSDFLKVRYVSAAILFLSVTMLPASTAMLFTRLVHGRLYKKLGIAAIPGTEGEFLSGLKSMPKGEAAMVFGKVLLADVLAFSYGILVGWGIWTVLPLSVSPMGLSSRRVFVYSVVSTIILTGAFVILPRYLTLRWFANLSYYAAFSFFSFAGLAAAFGKEIYPYVRPAYGGGGAWTARLALVDTLSISPVVRAHLAGSVVVLDRDDHYLRLLYCSHSQSKLQSIEIRREAVAAIELDSVVTVPAFLRSCHKPAPRRRGPGSAPR
jgi:hypothetical protein